ncbi:MAG: hypothetical protein LBK06_05145 [Planctomycetaceae bacterium]|jgi:hypothetical protein|nr:hypothetical protein [Planctomycetaceae bacterium]
MFNKLIDRIDSVNDYVNPVVVRDMRRAFGCRKVGVAMIVYACLLVVTCLCVYFLCDLDSLEFTIGKNEFEFATIGYMFVVSISMVAGISMVCKCVEQNLEDEMFLITTITPRQYLHAYMFETLIFMSFYIFLFMPVILTIGWRLSYSLIWAAIILCGTVFITQIIILIILSFIALAKRLGQASVIGFGLCIGYFLFFPILLPWFFVCIVLPNYVTWLPLNTSHNLGIVSISILVAVSLLLLGSTAYKLSLNTFKSRKKSIIKMILFNIFCYTLLSTFIAVIYLCTAFVVFSFA